LQATRGRLATRLVAGVLVASLPISVMLAVVLTHKSSTSLTAAAGHGSEGVSRAVALRVEDWLSERKENMATIAAAATGRLADPATVALITSIDKAYADYHIIEVTDLAGRVTAASRPQGQFDPTSQEWFRTAASGQPVLTSVTEEDGGLHWHVAQPILGPDGRPQGVVAGDLDETILAELLDPELAQGEEVIAVDKDHHLVYDTTMGKVDAATLLAKGALHTRVDNTAVHNALAGETGSTRYHDPQGRDVVTGYDTVTGPGWALLTTAPATKVLAPVRSGRNLAILLVLIGAALATGFALIFARRTTAPIGRLAAAAARVTSGNLGARVEPSGTQELRSLSDEFNSMVASLERLVSRVRSASAEVSSAAFELSSSSEELAATTTEQSAAVTEASATTEELSRASGSIADTVDEVAVQAAETRDNLEQAEADILTSSERTLALAERVNEIGAILTLINEISDQTNLLALNAAIEAARAGESGRGFAVVAEEVRRLAERSKTSAANIATIIEGVHGETNATVMAMEKGAKQMQRGLVLLETVTEASAQVRLTTQQQRSATGQVVETMEQLTDASRQVSATTTQIAASAAALATLATSLETAAAQPATAG
jgi:methyl-accepting chemotaxis protein